MSTKTEELQSAAKLLAAAGRLLEAQLERFEALLLASLDAPPRAEDDDSSPVPNGNGSLASHVREALQHLGDSSVREVAAWVRDNGAYGTNDSRVSAALVRMAAQPTSPVRRRKRGVYYWGRRRSSKK